MKKTAKNKGKAKPKKLQLNKETLKDLGVKGAGPRGGDGALTRAGAC